MGNIVVVDEQFVAGFRGLSRDWPSPHHDVVLPDGWELDELASSLADADALITVHRRVDGHMLDLAPKLQVIARPGAGVDNVDVEAATARGVVVTNVLGARGRAVAEHAWFLILYLMRRAWLRDDPAAWSVAVGDQLEGRTLGILGLGDIGQRVARIGASFGMDLVAHTRTPNPAVLPDLGVEFTDLDGCLRRSHVVVLCVPFDETTHGLIDRSRLAVMPRGSYLINVARGGVVVTDDLADAIERGQIGGAGLDVTDPEPLAGDHRLRGLPNVIISPHVAGRSDRAQREAMATLGANLAGLLDGGPVDSRAIVNPTALRRSSR